MVFKKLQSHLAIKSAKACYKPIHIHVINEVTRIYNETIEDQRFQQLDDHLYKWFLKYLAGQYRLLDAKKPVNGQISYDDCIPGQTRIKLQNDVDRVYITSIPSMAKRLIELECEVIQLPYIIGGHMNLDVRQDLKKSGITLDVLSYVPQYVKNTYPDT